MTDPIMNSADVETDATDAETQASQAETPTRTPQSDPFARDDNLVRKQQVEEYFGLARNTATLWRWSKEGKIPPPRYVGNQRVWVAGEIKAARRKMLEESTPNLPPKALEASQ